MSIPTAICTNCGVLYYGWALIYRPGQHCSRCGAPLAMVHDPNEAVRKGVESQRSPEKQPTA